MSVHGQGHKLQKGYAKFNSWSNELLKSIDLFLGRAEKQCHLSKDEMMAKIEELFSVQLDRTERALLQLHFREILETMQLNVKALKQHASVRSAAPDSYELR